MSADGLPAIELGDDGHVPFLFKPNERGAFLCTIMGDRDQAVAFGRLFVAAPKLLAYAECERACAAYMSQQLHPDQLESLLARHGYSGVLGGMAMHQWLQGLCDEALAMVDGKATAEQTN